MSNFFCVRWKHTSGAKKKVWKSIVRRMARLVYYIANIYIYIYIWSIRVHVIRNVGTILRFNALRYFTCCRIGQTNQIFKYRVKPPQILLDLGVIRTSRWIDSSKFFSLKIAISRSMTEQSWTTCLCFWFQLFHLCIIMVAWNLCEAAHQDCAPSSWKSPGNLAISAAFLLSAIFTICTVKTLSEKARSIKYN